MQYFSIKQSAHSIMLDIMKLFIFLFQVQHHLYHIKMKYQNWSIHRTYIKLTIVRGGATTRKVVRPGLRKARKAVRPHIGLAVPRPKLVRPVIF